MHMHMIFLLETTHFSSGYLQVILSFPPEVSISLLRYPMSLERTHFFYSTITFVAFNALGLLNPTPWSFSIQLLHVGFI